ncbi:hypothetical protein [Maribacter aestuarii]|uniref:hypothetical protein n=1 Tax=Maribacter aestuarii TaxID=1130723 RepID=UPI0025A600C7|nr:hypothetical protein [Maribacter aestuarii]
MENSQQLEVERLSPTTYTSEKLSVPPTKFSAFVILPKFSKAVGAEKSNSLSPLDAIFTVTSTAVIVATDFWSVTEITRSPSLPNCSSPVIHVTNDGKSALIGIKGAKAEENICSS